MKKLLRKIIDSFGITVIRNSRLPIGTDYRKTIRELYGQDSIKTVFDVGANVGQFCLHCHEIFNHSSIYSFEPILPTFNVLKQNTANVSQINCFHSALGSTKGKAEVFLQKNSTINSLNPQINIKRFEEQVSEVITIDTLDSFSEAHKIEQIDLLKIDTEGFDLEVLKGAKSLLENKKIRFVFIEVSFDSENIHNSSYQTINSYLESFGFKIHGFYNQTIHSGSTRMNYCDALFYLQN